MLHGVYILTCYSLNGYSESKYGQNYWDEEEASPKILKVKYEILDKRKIVKIFTPATSVKGPHGYGRM